MTITVNLFIERERTVIVRVEQGEPCVGDTLRLQSGFVDSENAGFELEIPTLNKVVLNK